MTLCGLFVGVKVIALISLRIGESRMHDSRCVFDYFFDMVRSVTFLGDILVDALKPFFFPLVLSLLALAITRLRRESAVRKCNDFLILIDSQPWHAS